MAETLADHIVKDLQKKIVSDVSAAAMKTLQLMPDEFSAGLLLIGAFEDLARGCTELMFLHAEPEDGIVVNNTVNMLLGAAAKVAGKGQVTSPETLIEIARQLRTTLDGILPVAAAQG